MQKISLKPTLIVQKSCCGQPIAQLFCAVCAVSSSRSTRRLTDCSVQLLGLLGDRPSGRPLFLLSKCACLCTCGRLGGQPCCSFSAFQLSLKTLSIFLSSDILPHNAPFRWRFLKFEPNTTNQPISTHPTRCTITIVYVPVPNDIKPHLVHTNELHRAQPIKTDSAATNLNSWVIWIPQS